MHVLANADTPEDAWKALELGAEGIGLCRTEHMFFKPERLNLFRHMILCDKEAERGRSLESLLPMQRNDFVEGMLCGETHNVKMYKVYLFMVA